MDQKRLLTLLARVVRNEHSERIALLDALQELDEMSGQDGLEGQLQHYLSKRSYEKALVQLETGRSCGHHKSGA